MSIDLTQGREFSDLFHFAESLIAFARRVLPVMVGAAECNPEDIKYLTILGFAHKVLKSTEAVRLLYQNGYGEDAASITRTIVEAVINAARLETLAPEDGTRQFAAYKNALNLTVSNRIDKNYLVVIITSFSFGLRMIPGLIMSILTPRPSKVTCTRIKMEKSPSNHCLAKSWSR